MAPVIMIIRSLAVGEERSRGDVMALSIFSCMPRAGSDATAIHMVRAYWIYFVSDITNGQRHRGLAHVRAGRPIACQRR